MHAMDYLTKLQLQGPNHPMSNIYTLNELVNILESNAPDMSNPNSTAYTINKFKGANNKDLDNNTNNNTRRKFTYRREVQCDCCQTFGHNVDEDICRVGAQVYHTTNYIKENPRKAENNAKAFTAANNKTKINAISTVILGFFEDVTTQEDYDNRITTLASLPTQLESPEHSNN